MGRRRVPRLPVEPLFHICGTERLSTIAKLIGEIDPRNFYRYVKTDGGLPVHYAEKIAIRLGHHPQEIWGDMYDAIDCVRVDLDTVRYIETDAMSEASLLAAVRQAARLYGWETYHTHDSRRSEAGFPDLVLVRAPRLIFAELKTARGKMSDDQKRWQNMLEACDAEWYLWRPADLEDIVTLLGRDMQTRSDWTSFIKQRQKAS